MRSYAVIIILSLCLCGIAHADQCSAPNAPTWCQTGKTLTTGFWGVNLPAVPNGGSPLFAFATFPQNWVNDAQCDPVGGYDATKNIPGDYPATPTGFQNMMNDWATTGTNVSWHVIIAAGSVIDCTDFSVNSACITAPAKFVSGAATTKCLVIESSTPLPKNQIACSHGLPGFGGTRNPGCDGHIAGANDVAKMWTILLDSSFTAAGQAGIVFQDDDTKTAGLNYPNHIVLRDIQVYPAPGKSQSHGSPKPPIPIKARDFWPAQAIGLERYYIHGNMPGDPGQPTTGSSVIAAGQIGAGSCVAWQFTSTVNVSGTTVTWVSGKRFGMTLSAGASVSINNSGVANNTVASHDILGADQDTQFTLGSSAGTLTNATLIWANPPSQWVGGCGDDIEDAVDWNCDNCWMKDGYVEKVHWINSESHAVLTGFSNGPVKFVNNWWEGGSCSYFSGGGPVDTSAGPTNDEEVRKNYFGRDESYRQLSAGVANSPEPPFGCGPMDHNAAHDTCPFQWAIKNTFELKLANRFLVDGNIIENAWADGQSGYPVLITDAVCSGGKVCGIKTNTGDPRTSIQNVHISNTWIRNAAMPIQLKNRAGGPGVGGGLATAVSNIDFYNDLITNVDDNEWGNNASGTAQTDIVQWQAGANNYLCTMSRVSNVATATCSAGGLTNTGKWANSTAYSIGNAVVNDGGLYIASTNHTSSTATKPPTGASWQANWTRQASNTYALPLSSGTLDQITRDASGLVTVSMGGQRVDILNGGTVFLGGQSGWNGTFTINAVFFGGGTGTPGSSNTLCNATNVAGTPNNIIVTAGLFVSNSCMRADGTFSTTFTYQDNTNPHVAGTLCSAATTSCDSMPNMAFSFPSLAYNNTDIHIGDGVITSECLQSNLSTVDATYPTPSNSSVLAATGTVTPGLAVAYANTGANDSSGVVCALENDAGQPKNMLWSQNTTLITNLRSIGGSALNIQSINNYFTNNIFETTGANKAILRCDATGNGEGTVSGGGADCWDRTTLQWGNNVMVGRATINWPPVNGSANFTSPSPSTVDCPGGTASSSCVGMSGFMNGITFPTTACTATLGNQNNCPLMAAPWATNVTLNSFGLVGSSSYQGLGADTTQMNTAFTNSGYVCPVGISCGSHGPYPD